MTDTIGVGIIGTGNIADGYVSDLLTYPEVEVVGVSDIDQARAEAFAAKYGIQAFADSATLLADPEIQVAVNLTPPAVHRAVSEQALRAGKHVYSEKPLALTSDDAWALVEIAKTHGLRLACSPFTMIGEAQQTAWKLIREGKLGQVRVIYGEANWGRIEGWHPAPQAFYKVGAFFDVGVYILGLVTSFFGPARTVTSYGTTLLPDRVTLDGTPYTPGSPDWILTLIELENGIQVRLTTGFYVSNRTTRQTGLEVHGDLGSLHLDSWLFPNAALSYASFGDTLEPVSLIRPPQGEGIAWGRGVYELVCAIREERAHRFDGEQAAHIADILAASNESLETGQRVTIQSSFALPQPAEWAQ